MLAKGPARRLLLQQPRERGHAHQAVQAGLTRPPNGPSPSRPPMMDLLASRRGRHGDRWWSEIVMTNYQIQEVRDAIGAQDSSRRDCRPEERFGELSPCERYELEMNGHAPPCFPHYATIAVATIRAVATGEIIATIRAQRHPVFFTPGSHATSVITSHSTRRPEGQTVADLSSFPPGRVVSRRTIHSSRTEFYPSRIVAGRSIHLDRSSYPSPDRTKLAIVGCYWACPYLIVVYDFREPLNLPLPTIVQFELPGNDAKFGEWASADSFTALDRHGVVHVFDLSSIE